MKRVGGLFDAIASVDTLRYASWRASRGKRTRPEIREFNRDLDARSAAISRELRIGTFQFGAYRSFPIRDPKTRIIRAPSFRDRVVHHAILRYAGEVFERGAIAHSYACRKGRGQHAALSRADSWIQPGTWFYKIDVSKYYDSVDHELLRALLGRRFRELRLLDLFDRLLDSYSSRPGKGLPIGALTSQYLGNFYMDSFDHWVNQGLGIRRYLRYMDDMLFIGSENELSRVREQASVRLEGLGLAAKSGGVLNRCELGVPYLGFVLYPNRIRMNRRARRRLRRRMKAGEIAYERGVLNERGLRDRAASMFAHAAFGDDIEWRRTVCKFSRIGETQEPGSRDAGRLVEQHGQELPLGVSQQEASR